MTAINNQRLSTGDAVCMATPCGTRPGYPIPSHGGSDVQQLDRYGHSCHNPQKAGNLPSTLQ